MKTTRILFVMALICSLGMQAEAKKVKLVYQMKAGDQFQLVKTVTQDVAQEVMGQSQSTTSSTSMTFDFKVQEVTGNGDFVVEVATTAYSINSANPMGEMKYDSATDKEVPDFARPMVTTLNEVYTLTISPLGKVLSATAPEGLADRVKKALESLGESQMPAANDAAAAAATADGFGKSVESMLVPFPEESVQTKTPWESATKTQQMILFDMKTKYELVSSNKEKHEIKVNGTITQDPSAVPMEMNGMSISYNLLGASEGTMILDAATGLLNNSEVVTSISGTVQVDSPQLPSPMSIPVEIRSTEKIIRK